MSPKISHFTRSLSLLGIIFTIFILTVVILRTPPKFFIYLLREDITGGFVQALLPPTTPTAIPIPTPLTTFLPSQNPGKKIFRNVTAGFEIEVPEGWSDDGGRLYGEDTYYSMMYRSGKAEAYSEKENKILSFADPLLYEQALVDNIGECDKDCIVARHSKAIVRDGIKGVRFENRSREDREGNDQGYTHHTVTEVFILNGEAYRFWSWQAENPKPGLLSQYPQTHPTPLDYFDQIMSTLKFL